MKLQRFAALLLILFLAAFAFAQKSKGPIEKSITGVVSDAKGDPIPGAVVQLKNMKTLQIRSFIARDKGAYIFQGLAADVDWEVKAMSDGKFSKARTVSTFDNHTAVTVNLQIQE